MRLGISWHNSGTHKPLSHKAFRRNFDRMRLALLPLRLRSFGVDDLADVIAREPGRVDDVDLPGALRGLGADRLMEDGTTLIGSFLGAMVRAGDALELVDAFLLGAVHGDSMPHRYAYAKALNEADTASPLREQTSSAYNVCIFQSRFMGA